MPNPIRLIRHVALVALLAASSAMTALAAAPAAHAVVGDVTEQDVALSNQKVSGAYSELMTMWNTNFSKIGRRFVEPQLARYRGAARTACGIVPSGNALYCPNANAVFYDEMFVARQAKAAAAELGTDGDMAGIGIIAHEVGHSVTLQLGEESRVSYENEARADCLAGAFVLQAKHDGLLDPGDLEEALFGMAAAGDPVIQSTGNERLDNRIAMRLQRVAHGTSEQRTSNFKAGYDGGPGACLPEFATRAQRR
jgi:predicted metalloprotease